MIFDCCLLFNEVELLLLRMEYLDPVVDYFVVSQARETFSGNPKEFALSNDLPPSFERFRHKMILNITPNWSGETFQFQGATSERFHREALQRNHMTQSLHMLATFGDTVLMSDVDEIPDIENVKSVRRSEEDIAAHHLKFYRYYLNTWIHEFYPCTIQTRWPLVMTPQDYRNLRFQHKAVYGGWHFSSLYDQSTKLSAFSHEEYDTPYWHAQVKENKRLLVDPFNRNKQTFKIEDPRDYFPTPVKEDPDRWGDWIYKKQ